VRSGDDRQVCHRLLQHLALARCAIIGIYFPPIPWPMTDPCMQTSCVQIQICKSPCANKYCSNTLKMNFLCVWSPPFANGPCVHTVINIYSHWLDDFSRQSDGKCNIAAFGIISFNTHFDGFCATFTDGYYWARAQSNCSLSVVHVVTSYPE